MPFCPACREEYREGFSRCADCAVDLVAARPSAPSPVPAPAPTGGWSEVFHGDPQSADILRSLLETGGVKTIAPDAMMPQFRHSAPSTDGKVRIFVATTDLPKVQEILREDPLAQISENEEELVRFPCPCGQTLETPVQAAGSSALKTASR